MTERRSGCPPELLSEVTTRYLVEVWRPTDSPWGFVYLAYAFPNGNGVAVVQRLANLRLEWDVVAMHTAADGSAWRPTRDAVDLGILQPTRQLILTDPVDVERVLLHVRAASTWPGAEDEAWGRTSSRSGG